MTFTARVMRKSSLLGVLVLATALSAQRWFSVVWLSVLTRRQGAARFGLCRSGSPVEKAGTVPEARTRLLNAADFDGIGRADFSPVSV